VRTLDRLQPLALFCMRLTLGAIMVAHGYSKVFGGLHHFAGMVASLGMPAWLAYVSALTEFLGGLLILAGLFSRAAALAIFIDLGVAIWKVHLHNGLIGSPNRPGYELPLAAATLAFALIFFAAGPISLDEVLRGGGGGTSKRS
jgi:putative oxidoreductase